MKKIIYLSLVFILMFVINISNINAGCGPKGCTYPLTDDNPQGCTNQKVCNCEGGPMSDKCKVQKPEVYDKVIQKAFTKEVEVYDIGYIAVWKSSGGVWQNGYVPGNTINNVPVTFYADLSGIPNAKSLKFKSISQMNILDITLKTNSIVRVYSVENFSINASSLYIDMSNLSSVRISFYLNSATLTTYSNGNYGQNAKLPYQLDNVEGYFYYVPTKIVFSYEPTGTCNINNEDHFGVDIDSVPGTGPDNVNCCNYFVDLYKDNPTELNNLYTKYPQCKKSSNGDGGGGGTPPANQCFYSINVTCPGNNCSSQNSGQIKDTDNWDCIFQSRNSTDVNIKDHYFEYSNQYCSIYCREEIDYYFPKNTMTVLSGTHFTVGTGVGLNVWQPISFKGTTTCRTDKIDYQKFEDDWADADDIVSNRWDDYQIALKKKEALDNATQEPNSNSCDCTNNVGGFACCTKTKTETYTCRGCGACRPICVTIPFFGKICAGERCSDTRETRTVCAEYNRSQRYTYNKPATVYYDGKNVTPGGWCSNNSKPSVNTSSSAYDIARNSRDGLLNSLRTCNEWQYDYNTFKPDVTVSYDEPRYGTTTQLNSSVTTLSSRTRYYVGSLNNTTTTSKTQLISKSICENRGIPCNSVKNQTYPVNDGMIYEISKETKYSLPSNTYRYINKLNGLSSNTIPGENYIDIGYGNFPVHFSTKTGKYNISLLYTSFGASGSIKNKFDKFVFGGLPSGSTLMNVTRTCSNRYSCTYNILNDILDYETPPGGENTQGLDIIFRQIDLKNPFPGISGKGRPPGDNWNDPTTIKNVITNNRGVEGNDIYLNNNVEPMYTITLDPILIQKIRSYNRKVASGYADFNLTCQTGKGTNCKSKFIRENPDFKDYFKLADCVKSNVAGCIGKGR